MLSDLHFLIGGGRGTRTPKSFRTTVFKTVRLPISVALPGPQITRAATRAKAQQQETFVKPAPYKGAGMTMVRYARRNQSVSTPFQGGTETWRLPFLVLMMTLRRITLLSVVAS
jgi:hypothetical protein